MLATCTEATAPLSRTPLISTLSGEVTPTVRPVSVSSQRSTCVRTTAESSRNSPTHMHMESMT